MNDNELISVAMLIYPNFTSLDLVGPQQVLAGLTNTRIDLIAKSSETVFRLKHVFTWVSCVSTVQPAGATTTAKGRPSPLGWRMPADTNWLEVSWRQMSTGRLLRSNEKQLAQLAIEQSNSVAGKVASACRMPPVPRVTFAVGAATLSMSRTTGKSPFTLSAMGFTLLRREGSVAADAAWEKAARATAAMAKNMVEV